MKYVTLSPIFFLFFLLCCDSGDSSRNETQNRGGGEQDSIAKLKDIILKTDDDNFKLALYDKIIEMDPRDSHAYFERAFIYKNLGNYDNAIQDFTRAIKFDDPDKLPTKAEVLCNRGDVYALIEEYFPAIDDYSEAIREDPLFADAYKRRSDIYMYLGETDEAERDKQTYENLTAGKFNL